MTRPTEIRDRNASVEFRRFPHRRTHIVVLCEGKVVGTLKEFRGGLAQSRDLPTGGWMVNVPGLIAPGMRGNPFRPDGTHVGGCMFRRLDGAKAAILDAIRETGLPRAATRRA